MPGGVAGAAGGHRPGADRLRAPAARRGRRHLPDQHTGARADAAGAGALLLRPGGRCRGQYPDQVRDGAGVLTRGRAAVRALAHLCHRILGDRADRR